MLCIKQHLHTNTGDFAQDAAAARVVGRFLGDPPGGPQRAQRPHVHRQVHAGRCVRADNAVGPCVHAWFVHPPPNQTRPRSRSSIRLFIRPQTNTIPNKHQLRNTNHKQPQVPRILAPIVQCLEQAERVYQEDDGVRNLIKKSFGGLEKLKKDILHDFFRNAFDGSGKSARAPLRCWVVGLSVVSVGVLPSCDGPVSRSVDSGGLTQATQPPLYHNTGGDNFFDAGSCIDGRLTSAWNWCSQLPHKPFYSIFKLTGFLSFDGDLDK